MRRILQTTTSYTVVASIGSGGQSFAYSAPGTPPAPAPAPAPAPSGPFSQTFRVKHRTAKVNPEVTLGHAFAQGDVLGTTNSMAATSDSTSFPTPVYVQMDQKSYWPDGSIKFAVLSFIAPETVAVGDVHTYTLNTSTQAQQADCFTLAQLTAASDWKLHLTRGDYGADVFEASVNAIAAAYTSFPWGSNPLGGWEKIRGGAACVEYRFWSFLKRTSDNAFHKWVKAIIYVRYWSSGAFEVVPVVRQSNVYGPAAGATVGPAAATRFAGEAELFNGAVAMQVYGGTRDPRTVTIPASAFTTGGYVNIPAGLDLGYNPVACTFSPADGGSTLPNGLIAGTPYFFVGVNYSNPNTPYISAQRYQVGQYAGVNPPGWQANHGYNYGDHIVSNGALYTTYASGTSGTTAPSGTQFTDGTVIWKADTQILSGGAGNIVVSPLVDTYSGTQWIGMNANADTVWGGTATRSQYLVAHDEVYLTRKTKLLPPYGLAVTRYTSANAPYRYSIGENSMPWDPNQTGDGYTDQRVGYLSQIAANCILAPFDALIDQETRKLALNYVYFPMHWEDERRGKIVVGNNGPNNTGAAYPNLAPPNPGVIFYTGSGSFGSPAWTGVQANSGYIFRYNTIMDGSHLPSFWIVPYLRTGHHVYVEQGEHQANTNMLSRDPAYSNHTVGGVTYFRSPFGYEQVRGQGWGMKALGTLRHLMPASDPMHSYFEEMYQNMAAHAVVYCAAQPVALRNLGFNMRLDEGGLATQTYSTLNPQMYHYQFLALSIGMEKWRESNAGWDAILGLVRPYVVGIYDTDAGGSDYWCSTRYCKFLAYDGSVYPSVSAMMHDVYGGGAGAITNAPVQSTGCFDDGVVSSGQFQGQATYPQDTTKLTNMTLSTLAVLATAGDAQARVVYNRIVNRVSTGAFRGFVFSGASYTNNPNPSMYPCWNIEPAP